MDLEFDRIINKIDEKGSFVCVFHITFTHPYDGCQTTSFYITHSGIHRNYYYCKLKHGSCCAYCEIKKRGECTCENLKEYFVVGCSNMFYTGDAPYEIGQSLDANELKNLWLESHQVDFKYLPFGL